MSGGETANDVSGWNVDTALAFIIQRFRDTERLLDERYATQTKALDAAFSSAEKAVAVALANAEKATDKAERSSDKRFDSVNEFRQQLADIISTFMTRIETEARLSAISEKLADIDGRLTAGLASLELRVTSRLDTSQGNAQGVQQQTSLTEAKFNQRLVMLGVLISVVVVIAQITISLVSHHI